MSLGAEHCVACRADAPPVTGSEIAELHPQVAEWRIIAEDGIRKLDRTFRVRNFAQALTLTNAIGNLAEEEGHHPRLVVEWGRIRVTWWTHKIRDLHRNDFIMASRSDTAYHKLLAAGEIEETTPKRS